MGRFYTRLKVTCKILVDHEFTRTLYGKILREVKVAKQKHPAVSGY